MHERNTPSYSFWEERSKRVLAQGATGTNSKRPEAFIHGVTPTHLVRAEGCYVWDWQGKKYLDMVGGLGPNILGYRHPMVSEAVIREIARGGGCWPLASTLEVEVAEKLCELIHGSERVRFFKNGDDSTCAAARIARAVQFIRNQK